MSIFFFSIITESRRAKEDDFFFILHELRTSPRFIYRFGTALRVQRFVVWDP